jgi:hypothetical protein
MEIEKETSINQIIFDHPSRKKTNDEYNMDHIKGLYQSSFIVVKPSRIVIDRDELWLREIWRIELLSIIKYKGIDELYYNIKMGCGIREKIYTVSQFTYDRLLKQCREIKD